MFPFVAAATNAEPGHPFYIPPQGGGRIDNPSIYSVLYLSSDPAGAVAEAFGRLPEWTDEIFEGPPALAGSSRSLARFELADNARMCDLDDPRELMRLNIRPSDVVSREYARTRAWALQIHSQQKWSGIRWWSYYDPRWASFGIWDMESARLGDVASLSLDHEAVLEASRTIARRIVRRRGALRPIVIPRKPRSS